MAAPLPTTYTLRPGLPPPAAYNALRALGSLTPVSPAQAAAAVRPDGHGTWAAVMLVWTPPPGAAALPDVLRLAPSAPEWLVGMGRVLGDGAWYFHLADVVVHPEHQRRGLGDAVLKHLLRCIREGAPDGGRGAYVTLLADPPGVRLYEQNGFRDLRSVPGGERGMGFRME